MSKKISIPSGFGTAQNFVAALADEVGGLISYVDSRERLRYASKALADWLGCTPEEAVGKTLREVYGEQTYAQFEVLDQARPRR